MSHNAAGTSYGPSRLSLMASSASVRVSLGVWCCWQTAHPLVGQTSGSLKTTKMCFIWSQGTLMRQIQLIRCKNTPSSSKPIALAYRISISRVGCDSQAAFPPDSLSEMFIWPYWFDFLFGAVGSIRPTTRLRLFILFNGFRKERKSHEVAVWCDP
jgi:hypothetical protein